MENLIQITEVLQQIVAIEAKTEDDTENTARKVYNNCNIVLSYSDFDRNVEIETLEVKKTIPNY